MGTHDDKDKALAEARKLYDTDKHSNGIKIFEEKYDDKDNRANTRIIFKKERGSEKKQAKKKTEDKKETAKPTQPPLPTKPKKKGFFNIFS